MTMLKPSAISLTLMACYEACTYKLASLFGAKSIAKIKYCNEAFASFSTSASAKISYMHKTAKNYNIYVTVNQKYVL